MISKIILFFNFSKKIACKLLYLTKLTPANYYEKCRGIYFADKLNKEFKKLKTTYYEDRGYYKLEPMPTPEFLNNYYNNAYWQNRSNLNNLLRLRDIEHYNLILDNYEDFNSSKRKVLNFGSGHGGISYLMYVNGHEVYNFDYSITDQHDLGENWKYINSLEEINFEFDLIYASHSLEHVLDIEQTLESFKKISNNQSLYFFEVPNCFYKHKIHPPHTYYFTKKFFLKYYEDFNLYCDTFTANKVMKENEGVVIRFLKKEKKK